MKNITLCRKQFFLVWKKKSLWSTFLDCCSSMLFKTCTSILYFPLSNVLSSSLRNLHHLEFPTAILALHPADPFSILMLQCTENGIKGCSKKKKNLLRRYAGRQSWWSYHYYCVHYLVSRGSGTRKLQQIRKNEDEFISWMMPWK